MQSFPFRHSSLQRPQHALVLAGVLVLQMLEQRHRFQFRLLFEHRFEFTGPDLGQRVSAGAPVAGLALLGLMLSCFDAASTALTKSGFGRCR